jgi:hypothetical protein
MGPRHCEERSDEAIQLGGSNLITLAGILSGLLRFARNDGSESRHCEERSDEAIQLGGSN